MPFKLTARRLLICCGVILAAFIILRPPKTVSRGPWIARNDGIAEMQRALSWYVDRAHGALNPPLRGELSITPETLRELIRAGMITEEEAGILSITPPYRSSMWWPGRSEPQKLVFSAYSYDILDADKGESGEESGIRTQQLTVQLKIRGASPSAERLREQKLDSLITTAPGGAPADGLVSLPVTMYKGIYGYYLPIPRAIFDSL